MSDKSDERIIDACLDEILGGQRPPNLTERITRALDGARTLGSGPASLNSLATRRPASPAATPTPAIKVAKIKVAKNRLARRTRRQASPWLAVAASVALIGLGGVVVWVVWNATEQRKLRDNQIAYPEPRPRPFRITPVPPSGSLARVAPEPSRDPPAPALKPAAAKDNSVAMNPLPSSRASKPVPEIDIRDERPAALPDEQIVAAINELIRVGWQREGITPAKPVTDEQWCERVYAKLIGRAPRPREVSAFVRNRSTKKREVVVDLLLQGEDFASRWSRTWTDILVASGNQNNSDRDGLEQYLRNAFGDGKPFDEMASELLTATGSTKIDAADYNGAVNFLVAHKDRDGVNANATAHVSRTFLALSLECSQCHTDSTWSGVKQQRFWELNAFFRQLNLKRDGDRGWLASDANLRPRGARSADGETYYSLPDGTMRAAYPVFVDGTEIPRTPNVAQVNRRDLLAKLVTRSEQFRQAVANRFWAELFGVGFTIPADNIGPHNPPSHPELLAELGGQFAAHDYDVRALIRWIALSEPFALSSGDVATQDQIGAKLAFDRFPQARDSGEPVLKQLRVARGAYAGFVDKSGTGATPARVTPTTVPGAVPTELSDVDKGLATVGTEARRLSKTTVYGNYILESDMSLEQKIQHMFFATLHRAPTAREQKAVKDVLESRDATPSRAALEYVWWALASSQEAR